ncbi:MAG TPA: methionyl-tRNA formyltransferase [Candidatus Saccharimonadales bacterium]
MQETKVIFFGNEKLATGIPNPQPLIKDAIVKAGFEIEQIITGNLAELKPHDAKLAVLAAYGHIIPQRILDQFPLGIINIHPSLLPQYRGTTPIEQALLDGVEKTGVSIMHLTAGMDEGPLYRQKTLHLGATEQKLDLTTHLHQLGADILQEILPAIASSNLKPHQQPHPARATYTPKLVKSDGIIDLSQPADFIERQIRAFSGWPGSRTTLGSIDVIITKAHVSDTPTDLSLECGDGKFLAIDTLKPAGKKEMPVKAFLAGYKNKL